MRMQRSGLPLMILAGVLLVAAALVVLLVASPFGEADARTRRPETESAADDAPVEPEQSAPEATPADEPAPEPEPDPPPVEEPEPVPATTVAVGRGDTLYDIASRLWDDPFLWPLLLAENEDDIEDPDYLRPDQRVDAPAWVTVESGLTDERRARLSQAHVLAYSHYRDLGEAAIGLGMGQPEWWRERLGRQRLNKAHWVLYSGLRYDEGLLDRYAASIRDEDVRDVRGFVERFGLPPYRR
ncbi:MAG: LysM peptidoglycan-binding domain-containing protein [Spirochaetota bacterium]